MKRLLLTVVIATLFVFGLFAQKLEPLSMYKKSKSEQFDIIAKDGKPFGIEEVSVVIFNNGAEIIAGEVELAYQVNGGTEIVETFTVSELEPGVIHSKFIVQ